MGILQLLASRNYIVVNKELIKIIGLEESIILGELASEYNYYLDRNELEDGYFYSTIENIENNTGLNEYKQRKAMNSLKNKEIVEIKIKGIPAKRYIKLNENQVIGILNNKFQNNLRTSSLNFKELELKNLKGNNNIINNNKNNNKYNIYGEFQNVKLTDEEYLKIKERNLLPYIEKLSSYIASKGKKYKSHYATILTWARGKETTTITPKWFNEKITDEQISLEEQNELENILKEMGE